MVNKLKKRYRTRMCFILTFLIMITATPVFSLNVKAAPVGYMECIDWGISSIQYNGYSGKFVRVEVGQQLPLGQFYCIYGNEKQLLEQLTRVKYASSDKAIASISGKGMMTAKKMGDVIITITRGGLNQHCFVQVVKKGALKATAAKYKKIHSYAKSLSAYLSKSVTDKNCYKISGLSDQLEFEVSKIMDMQSTGFQLKRQEKVQFMGQSVNGTANLIEPKMIGIYSNKKLEQYIEKNDPASMNNKNHFAISKITAKKNTKQIDITLKKKVSRAQIFALKNTTRIRREDNNQKKAYLPMWIVDTRTGYRYFASADAIQGSDRLTFHTDYLKLRSGVKYRVEPYNGWFYVKNSWTKNKTFKAR